MPSNCFNFHSFLLLPSPFTPPHLPPRTLMRMPSNCPNFHSFILLPPPFTPPYLPPSTSMRMPSNFVNTRRPNGKLRKTEIARSWTSRTSTNVDFETKRNRTPSWNAPKASWARSQTASNGTLKIKRTRSRNITFVLYFSNINFYISFTLL